MMNVVPSTRQPAGSTPPHHKRRLIPSLILILILTILAGLIPAQLATAAVDCNDDAWQVADDADLAAAIGCFNAKPAGDYSITFTQDIFLTVDSTTIDNATAGAALFVDGAGFTIDADQPYWARSFDIAVDSTVTIENITITGGNMNPNGAASEMRERSPSTIAALRVTRLNVAVAFTTVAHSQLATAILATIPVDLVRVVVSTTTTA